MFSFVKIVAIGTSLVVQWLRLCTANIGGLGLIPGQETRAHMLQLKNLCAATKTWGSQIRKEEKKSDKTTKVM